jgi:hypothetical protein
MRLRGVNEVPDVGHHTLEEESKLQKAVLRFPLNQKLLFLGLLGTLVFGALLLLSSSVAYTSYAHRKVADSAIPKAWLQSGGITSRRRSTAANFLPTDIAVYDTRAAEAARSSQPLRLKYPLVWQAAFWSQSGMYGTG